MLVGEGTRVGVVEREEVMFSGREARKALSMFMVRGTCFVADASVVVLERQSCGTWM